MKLGDTLSAWTGVVAEEPQGSIHGPLLFNMKLNKIFL